MFLINFCIKISVDSYALCKLLFLIIFLTLKEIEETSFSFAREKATAKYLLRKVQDICPGDLSGA